MGIASHIQSADWKTEKHVPAILCADSVAKGSSFEVEVTVGKTIAHPNTTEHHIKWIQLYFKPVNGKFVYEVGKYDFSVHGESPAGANAGPVHAEPSAKASMRITESGTLLAIAYCNIHGLWESQKEVTVE